MNNQPVNPIRPKALEMQDFYDALMAEINPDLMSGVIPELDRIYAGETAEQKAARLQGYLEAQQVLQERLHILMGDWQEELVAYKDQILQVSQAESQAEDRAHLMDIEQSLNDQ